MCVVVLVIAVVFVLFISCRIRRHHRHLAPFLGQRPRREPEGTKSCRIQGESVRPYIRTYVRTSARPPPEAYQRQAQAPKRQVQGSQTLVQAYQKASERLGPAS